MVWYSQILTSKIGIEKLRLYLDKINYGNNDLSGDATKNNGLTESWLSSSLKITPLQQIEFIENLAKDKLQFSKESQIKTKDLIKLFEESYFSNGWTIYGKTGTSDFDKINFKEGYFVGGNMTSLKTAENIKSIPVLIKNGEYEDTLQKLNTFANKKLKQATKHYNSLLEFATQLS